MKEYTNDQITVYWQPEFCAHPGHCTRLLPAVFDLARRPWVNVNGAPPEAIIATIDQCPSGALRYSLPPTSTVAPAIATGTGLETYAEANPPTVTIRVERNGPYLVEGTAVLVGADGEQKRVAPRLALCRCGHSDNPPYCTGAHHHIDWYPDGD